jgi:hypothetical protein
LDVSAFLCSGGSDGQQFGSCFGTWLCQVLLRFGTTFVGTRFDSVWTISYQLRSHMPQFNADQ